MKKVFSILFIAPLLLIFAGPAFAVAPYNFGVDRFEVEGNLPGSTYDEFDNANLSPEWYIDAGTAVESGGVVTLSNPGMWDTFRMGSYFVTNESSEIASSGNSSFKVSDGAGNFNATSTWLSSSLPAENQWYGMQADIDEPDGTQLELVKIGLFNASPSMATLLGGSPTGLGVSFGQLYANSLGAEFYTVSINETDITDDILFRLTFDDTTNQFDGTFSLDGGTTFHNPFPSVNSSMGGPGVFSDWELNAMSSTFELQVVPEPISIILFPIGAGVFGFFKKRKIIREGRRDE